MAGFGLARVLSRALVTLLASDGTPLYLALATNWRVLGFTTALAIGTCVLFGLVPALRATRTSPEVVMRAHGRGLTASRERFTLRRALVVGQMAVSLVLVAGSLLFARSFTRVADVHPGFDPDPVLRVDLDLRPAGVPEAQLGGYHAQVLDRLRAMPGVVAASYAEIIPLTGSGWNQRAVIDGVPQDGTVFVNRVSADYFETMQTPIVAGRSVRATDTASTPAVAVVNDLFVEKYLGGGQALGRRFRFAVGPNDRDVEFHVVGRVPNTKYYTLREAFLPIVYLAAGQETDPQPFQQVLLRSDGDPSALRTAVARALAEMHPAIRLTLTEYGDEVRQSLLRDRLMATLSGGFAVLALVLAAVGLYGLMAYTMARRRGEIGIRAALGATRGRLAAMIARETGWLVAIGVAAGAGLTVVATRATAALLFELSPSDPVSIVAAVALLASAAAAAVLVPTWRATRLSPVRALREE
jgi:predicted permease